MGYSLIVTAYMLSQPTTSPPSVLQHSSTVEPGPQQSSLHVCGHLKAANYRATDCQCHISHLSTFCHVSLSRAHVMMISLSHARCNTRRLIKIASNYLRECAIIVEKPRVLARYYRDGLGKSNARHAICLTDYLAICLSTYLNFYQSWCV